MTTARTSYKPTGCKAFGSKLSVSEMLQVERRVQVIRNRMERWLLRKYREMFRTLQERIESISQDRVPTDTELMQLIAEFRADQETVLRMYYDNLFPKIEELIVPDDKIKAWADGRETKDRDEFQRIMDDWLTRLMGIHIVQISDETLNMCRILCRQSANDPVVFMNLLRDSGLFGAVRARRIAVTETTSGINSAMQRASEQVAQNKPRVKIWHTTGRLNVRSTHRKMAGQTVDADELFRVPREDGSYDLMMYPGDSTHGASAANIVNCHCMVFYEYKK